MSAILQWAYPAREPIAYVTASVIALWATWLVSHPSVSFKEDDKEILLRLEALTPPSPPPVVPKVLEPVVKPTTAPVVPKPVVTQPLIKESLTQQADAPAAVQPQMATPVATTSATAAQTQTVPPAPVNQPEVKPEPVTVTVKAPAVSTSQAYIAQLLAYLEQIKRYPSSREARQTRPQGTVKVWLDINRAGQLLDVGVQSSSGSNLLDSEALKTIRAGRFPPMPEDAFAGDASHRFTASLKYTLD